MSDAPRLRFRDPVLKITPYKPGLPSDEVERELGIRDLVKLASNENCLGSSPLALEAGRRALERGVHLYPDGSSYHLRNKLAVRHEVSTEEVFVASGATEAILLLAQVMLEPGASAVCSHGAFHLYEVAIQGTGAEVRSTPLDADERHDLEAMAAAVTDDTRLLFVANPNNPTGTYVSARAVAELVEAVPDHVVVVIDEAYFEYVDAPDYGDALDLVRAGKPVVVLRTFSKVFGLAGMRIGYALGPAAVVDALDRVRSAFNVTGIAQAMALAALDDTEHVERSFAHNTRERAFLAAGVAERGYRCTPSVANFVLIDVGRDAEPVHSEILRRGVISRPMRSFGFPTRLRVSVGEHEHNVRFLRALDELGA